MKGIRRMIPAKRLDFINSPLRGNDKVISGNDKMISGNDKVISGNDRVGVVNKGWRKKCAPLS
jgi:hypothetical protein